MLSQLKERAERKVKEAEQAKVDQENADQAFFRKKGQGADLYDIEGLKERNERHQAILR